MKVLELEVEEAEHHSPSPHDFGRNDCDAKTEAAEYLDCNSQLLKILLNIW